ncbi:TFIIB-type zinc ribbon-containing protein [Methylobacter marinus]|uniref:TFIIB-type zinc ribbon-containing protein n=1 Tax=Methylobacter marinus TaxID=34058 RepID=UPI00036756CB|nr:zf-TFIIB domain-containing protein [Methylobacter marinus]
MNCPFCKTHRLKPTRLTAELPAESCSQCHGALVSLLSYRTWLDRHPVAEQLAADQQQGTRVEPVDASHALFCPKCAGIMTKYRIAAETENRIDLCVRCNEIWLDNGEWELIISLELADKLPRIFYDSWQKQIREVHFQDLKEQKFRELLGADYDEIVRIRDWIDGHAQRRTLLDYINSF